jgi:DNA-binding response OmpR family regulator
VLSSNNFNLEKCCDFRAGNGPDDCPHPSRKVFLFARFIVFYSLGLTGCAKLNADAGGLTRTGANVSQVVFVLEDDSDIRRLVQYQLEGAGYVVRAYPAVGSIVQDAERQRPALFLLDIMVPGGDGLDLCRRLRLNPMLASVPIIFLTARAGENDRVHGLELGADDYITKPFAMRELLARVKAVLRRFERPTETQGASSVLNIDTLEIDGNSMQLRVNNELVTTTATEFRLLDYLARHPGRVFSRDHLLDAVWGDARFVTPRSVDVYVRRIREKIEVDPETPRFLKTMRGAGYRFDLPKAKEASIGSAVGAATE